jgi:hypothetical protein
MTRKTTSYGPYRALFEELERSVRILAQGTTRQVPGGLWKSIPVPTETTLTRLAALYGVVYMGAEMSQLSFAARELLLDGLGTAHIGPGNRFELNLWLKSAPAVRKLFDGVVLVLDTHQCAGDPVCADAVSLYENQRLKGLQWLNDFLLRTGRAVNGQKSETYHPCSASPAQSDHSLDVERPGGDGQPISDQWHPDEPTP